ncbi:MAG: hypothetical protein E7648_02850 [Ruminococcaceae bacterium]|nr:hypothetical protein [Oscillospiraceae bacterium]MBO5040709.1 hypothetical protein [Clostridia bacterium]
MVKGSTPTFTLKLPVHTDMITSLEAIIMQEDVWSLIIEHERFTFDGYYATFTLEDWETMEFEPGIVELQITFRTDDAKVYVSDIRRIAMRKKYPEDAE